MGAARVLLTRTAAKGAGFARALSELARQRGEPAPNVAVCAGACAAHRGVHPRAERGPSSDRRRSGGVGDVHKRQCGACLHRAVGGAFRACA